MPMPGSPADEHHGAGDDAAAEHAVELADAGGDALGLAHVHEVVGLRAAARARGRGRRPFARRRRLLALLGEAVPLAAVGAAAQPLRALEAAGLAGEDRLDLGSTPPDGTATAGECQDGSVARFHGDHAGRPPRTRAARGSRRWSAPPRRWCPRGPPRPTPWARRRTARPRRPSLDVRMVGDVGHGQVHADGAGHRHPAARDHECARRRACASVRGTPSAYPMGMVAIARGPRRHPSRRRRTPWCPPAPP